MASLRTPAAVATSSASTLRSRLPPPHRRRPRQPQRPEVPRGPSNERAYATISGGPADSRGGERFPPWPRAAHPSPYEVLGIDKRAEYNKRAYYRLAKLYHPDANASVPEAGDAGPSATVRLERYRLLVAAHELLSDPGRRRLYDTTGFGWTQGHGAPSLRDVDRLWRSRPGSAANNATWEDWERWHAAREGRAPPEPAYMSHGMFASMVVGLCMVGWLAQLTRAESAGDQYMAWMAEQNARIGGGLARDGSEAMGRSRGERVDHFLRDRENTLYGYEPGRLERDEKR